MQFKELTIEELTRGYAWSDEKGTFVCIFCGEEYIDGTVYERHGRMMTAERAVREHVLEAHGGAFKGLIGLDKQINGLSDIQKQILEGMYAGDDNKAIGEEMAISAATVRTHKFNIQKMKREARILLALLENIENEEVVTARRVLLEQMDRDRENEVPENANGLNLDRSITGNSLHPFFTNFYLK